MKTEHKLKLPIDSYCTTHSLRLRGVMAVIPTLYALPDGVGPGAENVAPTHVVVLHHLCLRDYL